MSFEVWFYYLIAILVLTASPGPSVLLCLTKSVTLGFRSSFFSAIGSLTAIFIILSLSFTGLGLIVAESEIAFNAIKWCGAAYLIYLGYKAITSKQGSYEIQSNTSEVLSNWSSHYISGFIVGASNPKAIVFFTALFPQFINPEGSMVLQYLIFASTFIVLELFWLLLYSYMGLRSSRWLLKEGRAKVFNRITGGVFISAGLLLSNTSKANV